MIEEEHLKLFFTEQLYILPEDRKPNAEQPQTDASVEAAEAAPVTPEPVTEKAEEVVKHPVIVISEALSKDEKDLMDKILSAVHIKPNQVHHIVGMPKTSLSYDKLIIFGDFEVEGVGNDYYDVSRTTQMSLRAKPLADVNGDREEKMRLWNALKTWFGL